MFIFRFYTKILYTFLIFPIHAAFPDHFILLNLITLNIFALSKGCHLDVVRGPSTPHDPESDAGGSLSSWQGHPSR
jgi:hypothetical protein